MTRYLSLLFILVTFSVTGQQSLTGRVIDAKTEEPLIGTNVYSLSDYSVGAVSNLDGWFELDTSKIDKQDSILISFIGFQEVIISVSSLPRTIRLVEKENQMNAVSITAEPIIAEEFKRLEIKKLDIYTNPASKADALLAVNSLPSSTTTDESASISLRGSSPVETGIFLNGVPVYDAVRYAQLNGIGTFSLFNTSLVKSVDVFPGNPPLEFGNTTSGVVSIQTDEVAVGANSNQIIFSPANIGYQRNQRLGNMNMKVFTNYQPSGPLKYLNSKALADIEKFESLDAGVYIYGELAKKLSFKMYNYGLREGYIFNFEHPTFKGEFNQGRNRALNVTNLSMPLWNGTISWNQGFSFSKSRYSYSSSKFDVLNKSLFQGLNYYFKAEKLHIKTGLSYDYRYAEVSGSFFQYGYALGENHPTLSAENSVSAGAMEAFVYSKYYFTEQWVLGAGLRKNLGVLAKQDYLSKQINLTHIINHNWKVLAGIGNYHKEAIYENSTEQVSIQSNQVSLDVLYDKNTANFAFSLFHKNITENSEKTVSGMEVYINKRFNDQLTMDASYATISNQGNQGIEFADIGYFVRSNLSFTPNKFWTLSLNGVYRQGTNHNTVEDASFDAELDAYMPIYAEDFSRLTDYFILNFAASRMITISDELGMVAFLSINNVTDQKNVRSFKYNNDYSVASPSYLSRRLVYLGCMINF